MHTTSWGRCGAVAAVLATAAAAVAAAQAGATACSSQVPGGCRVTSAQLTVRDRPGRLYIGTIYQGTKVNAKQLSSGGVFGQIAGAFNPDVLDNICGWVQEDKTEHASTVVRGSCGGSLIDARSYARLVNCDECSSGARDADRVTAAPGAWPVYDNVSLFGQRVESTQIATVGAPGRNALSWRYVTSDGQWIAVVLATKDDGSDFPQAQGWGFVSTAALTSTDYCHGTAPKAPRTHLDYPNVCRWADY